MNGIKPVMNNHCTEQTFHTDNTVLSTARKPNQLLLALQTSEFNVSLAIINKLFQYTKPLSIYLQKKILICVKLLITLILL